MTDEEMQCTMEFILEQQLSLPPISTADSGLRRDVETLLGSQKEAHQFLSRPAIDIQSLRHRNQFALGRRLDKAVFHLTPDNPK